FAGPKAVLAYLSRYTHRVAISNRRLIAVDERSVTFKVKDYRIDGPGRYTTMTLDVGEFIRRFLIHVLPKGFHRRNQDRHLMSARHRPHFTSRGFLPWRLSDDGPSASRIVAMGRRPKPFTRTDPHGSLNGSQCHSAKRNGRNPPRLRDRS